MKDSLMAGENALYFDWLMELVGGDDWWDGYTPTMLRLFYRRYYYENELDSSTAQTAKDLRAYAIRNGVPTIAVLTGEASVLEVLVSLALRVNQYLLGDETEDMTPSYFNEIIEVLGMNVDSDYIDNAIDRFLSGKSQITRKRKLRPFEATLWQQVNMFFYDNFKLESDF